MNQTLRTENGRCVLRFERRLAHPAAKVWRALTERSEQKHWFPAELDADYRVGGEIHWVSEEGEVWTSGTVTVWDPPRVFEHTADGERMRFELRPDDEGCLLIFTHHFDDLAGAGSFAAGWHGCFDLLDRFLDDAVDPNAPNLWKERHETYVAEFGLMEGTAEHSGDGYLVRFERVFTEPLDHVWAFLMDSAEPDTTPAVGTAPPIAFTHGFDTAGPLTRLDEAMPAPTKWGETGKLLEYGWRLDSTNDSTNDWAEPDGVVRWEIIAGPGGMARVILTQTVPDACAEHRITALAAWHTHLELLAEHLKGGTPCWPDGRTDELKKHYAEQLER